MLGQHFTLVYMLANSPALGVAATANMGYGAINIASQTMAQSAMQMEE